MIDKYDAKLSVSTLTISYKKGILCLKKNFLSDLEIKFLIDMPHSIGNIHKYESIIKEILNVNIPRSTPNDTDDIL